MCVRVDNPEAAFPDSGIHTHTHKSYILQRTVHSAWMTLVHSLPWQKVSSTFKRIPICETLPSVRLSRVVHYALLERVRSSSLAEELLGQLFIT